MSPFSVVYSCSDESRPMKTNLGQLAFEATAVSFTHLKEPRTRKEWRKFIGIRESGWDQGHISNLKTVYAANNVSMAFVIIFYHLIHWSSCYRKKGVKTATWMMSWEAVLERSLGPAVDRVIDQSKMSRQGIPKLNI